MSYNIKYKRVDTKKGCHYSNNSKYVVVMYADDFVVLCKTLEDAEAVYGLLNDYLQERGLTLAPDKTKITNLYDGFDFEDTIFDATEDKNVIKCLSVHLKTVSSLSRVKPKISFAIVIPGTLKKVSLD